MAAYLADYAERLELPVRYRTEAQHVEPGHHRRWRVITEDEELEADSVIVATGYCRLPRIPDWPGREAFYGDLVHSSAYRNPEPYRARDVLVVGAGNSAAEIAADLAGGGAGRVRIAIRTPPHIVPRTVLRIPTIAIATRRLPPVVGDTVIRLLQRITVVSGWGLPRPRTTLSRQFAERDVVPITHPDFVPQLKERNIEVVGPVLRFDERDVVLGDDSRITPDAVIAATGYHGALSELVGELGLITGRDLPRVRGKQTDPNQPGIYFIGFTNPLSGNLRELRLDARQIARAITKEHKRGRPAPSRARETAQHPA